ncbi:MAG: hypothetical protein FJY97_05005 [candidate division Zixibacteria bacterium]|nr:hypothetical protein [candidate division Zixibacteria bacterium]
MQIVVDFRRMRRKDIDVLRDIVRLLLNRPFRFYISGVAACIWQSLLGGSGYTWFLGVMMPAPVAPIPEPAGLFLMLTCRSCQVRDVCAGLQTPPKRGTRPLFRLHGEERMSTWKTIRFQDMALDTTYRAILRHVATHDNTVAERAIVFARTYTSGSAAQYTERLVYFCCHMKPADMRVEKRLLVRLLDCRDHVARIFERYYEGCPVATVHSTFTAARMYTLAEEGIPLAHHPFERPYLIGIDMELPSSYRKLHTFSLDVSPDGKTDRATIYNRPRYPSIDG